MAQDSAMADEPVVRLRPLFLWDAVHQLPLGFFDRLSGSQTDAVAYAKYMGVNGDGVLPKCVR